MHVCVWIYLFFSHLCCNPFFPLSLSLSPSSGSASFPCWPWCGFVSVSVFTSAWRLISHRWHVIFHAVFSSSCCPRLRLISHLAFLFSCYEDICSVFCLYPEGPEHKHQTFTLQLALLWKHTPQSSHAHTSREQKLAKSSEATNLSRVFGSVSVMDDLI